MCSVPMPYPLRRETGCCSNTGAKAAPAKAGCGASSRRRSPRSALGVEEQRVNVLVDPAPMGGRWRAVGDGYRVDVRIIVDEREGVLTVPVSALFREGSQWMAFVVAGGRAHKRPLGLAGRGEEEALVSGGLGEGDIVVVYPGSTLADGSRVAPRPM